MITPIVEPTLDLVRELITKLESPLHERDAAIARGDEATARLIQTELDLVAFDLRMALSSIIFA